jgi:hypothetical protein
MDRLTLGILLDRESENLAPIPDPPLTCFVTLGSPDLLCFLVLSPEQQAIKPCGYRIYFFIYDIFEVRYRVETQRSLSQSVVLPQGIWALVRG